jgi:ubiquinone/menaquinone biosynthesis C-methylase UbiE
MAKRDDMIKLDGERFLPWMDDPMMNYEHLHRYAFAKEFVKDKTVLDLACGEGYGSAMLAEEAEQVTGIDINECAIKHAAATYVKSNLEFIKSSITKVGITGCRLFDVIVCFEALEHVVEHDKVVSEVKRLLKEDGIFIVSTPDKQLHTDTANYHNPFHLRELYFQEFKAILSENFKNNLTYGQKVFPVSNIFPISGNSAATKEYVIEKQEGLFQFTQLEKKQPLYFIAISSDAFISKNTIGNSYLIDSSESVFEAYKVCVSKKEAIITEQMELLNRIYNSFGWKVLSLYHKLRNMIFGKNRRIQKTSAS